MLNLHLPRTVGAWLDRLKHPHDEPDLAPADTVLRWPPTPSRVLSSAERHAHKCLTKALALQHPKGFLLSHVPLHKLVRVPRKNSYREWLSRTGLLTADFALCDEHGYVCAVVLMPVAEDQVRQLRRRERLLRVLEATGLPVELWERGWQGDDDETMRRNLFHRAAPRADGYYADTPHAEH
ncbi:hypothetical protein [Pelomonas cellulosilytica]|uniref:DUF2726 domain-containing protein n=1 Tax=Pelomonas cellulosilytica TaxID=2906762 RepID=A0ABS8XUQ2_9BURK|nr:hypothetical protein [Pelomonas sp. P8]MCE4552990.1 hypothetical protein [Pelomonas sp. P8]